MRILHWVAFSLFLVTPISVHAQNGPPPAIVSVEKVVQDEVSSSIEIVGQAHAIRHAQIAAESDGRIIALLRDEGDLLRTGETLLQLDTTQLSLSAAAAEAELGSAQSGHEEAQKQLNRSAVLFQKGRISEEEHDTLLFEVKRLGHEVKRLESEVARLKDLEARGSIRAPFDGVLASLLVDEGEWVSPGSPIGDFIDLSTIEVKVDLPDRYSTQLQREQEVSILFDALPGREFAGTVRAVVPAADPQSHTMPVYILVDNAEGELHAGMFARVALSVEKPHDALLVPKDAVVTRSSGSHVFAVQDGLAKKVMVQVIDAYGQKNEVEGELSSGQLVVTRGNERIVEGQPLQIPSEDGAASGE